MSNPSDATTSDADQAHVRRVVYLLIIGAWLVFFWPVITGQRQFAYRDTATLYYPLFEWTDRQWKSGEVPLWNPQDDLGLPVVADVTSSVFYPGKAVFWLPWCPFDARFGIYVALHVLLAALGGMWCARVLGCGYWGAGLAGLAYGFGAPVIFQTCNVVFLVGAAWLPWCLAWLWRFRATGKPRHLVALSAGMSLMVLGGDPQSAFHMGLIAIAVLNFVRAPQTADGRGWAANGMRRLGSSLAVLAIAVGLSAIQVIPGVEQAQRSERSTFQRPRSLYEIPTFFQQREEARWSAVAAGLFDQPIAGTHHDAIYQFSLPPWQVAEFVWPQVLGKMDFARDGRWSSQLRGADRIWVPSLYCGAIVFVLAVSQWRLRWGEPMQRILTWLLLFSLLGSFGWYGIGWLMNELTLMRGGHGVDSLVGAPVGGLYWLLVVAVPFYATFRYPAKLTVLAALALSLLAGRGLSRLLDGKPDRRLQRLGRTGVLAMSMVAGISGLGFGLYMMVPADRMQNVTRAFLAAEIPADELQSSAFSLLHVLWVLSLLAILMSTVRVRRRPTMGAAVLLIAMFDILLASWALVPTVARNTGQLVESEFATIQSLPPAIYRDADLDWARDRTTDDPLLFNLRHDQASLRPKFHLQTGTRLMGSYSSAEPLDLLVWKQLALNDATLSTEQRGLILQSVAVDGRLEQFSPQTYSVEEFDLPRPRFRLVHQYDIVKSIDETNWEQVVQRTENVIGQVIDHGSDRVVVETDSGRALTGFQSTSPTRDSSAGIIDGQVGLQRIHLRIDNADPALLVAADYFDANWRAEVIQGGRRESVPIFRANRIMRAIPIPAGPLELEMVYRPTSFYVGAWISGLMWLSLIGGLTLSVWHSVRINRGCTTPKSTTP